MSKKNIFHYDQKKISIYQIFQEKYSSYVYIIVDKLSRCACLVDPDLDNIEFYLSFIKKIKKDLKLAIDTHLHSDHVSGLKYLRNKKINSIMGYSKKTANIASTVVQDGNAINLGHSRIVAIHTPGHTEESYCFFIDNNLFTGDTLLINSTGRTDLKTGSAELLYASLKNKILTLQKETIIYPSHDYNNKKFSTLSNEIQNNPRLQIKSKSKFITTMNNLKIAPPKHYLEAVELNSSSYNRHYFHNKKSIN